MYKQVYIWYLQCLMTWKIVIFVLSLLFLPRKGTLTEKRRKDDISSELKILSLWNEKVWKGSLWIFDIILMFNMYTD